MSSIQVVDPLLDYFPNFLHMLWDHLRLPAPTEVQQQIAEFLQFGPKRKGIIAFRGVGKSWITSAYCLWKLKRKPDESKILVVSASKVRSDDFSTFTLRLINDVPYLEDLKPNPKLGHRESKIAFDVGPATPAHAPSVKSMGIFGQLAGSRATDIIADDVEVPNNSETQDKREKLLTAVAEFEAILIPDRPDTTITFLGTPQTEESIYNKLEPKGYTIKIWPSRYPSLEQCDAKYGHKLAAPLREAVEVDSSLVGHTTDPERFTDSDLIEREASYGRSGFALQFMLDTSLSDAERYPLKTSDLIVVDQILPDKGPKNVQWSCDSRYVIDDLDNVGFTGDRWHRPFMMDTDPKNWIDWEGTVMSIDPSGRGTDELAYAIVKQLHGNLYVPEVGGLREGYSDKNLKLLALIAKRHNVKHVVIESNFGDGMFTKILSPIMARVYPCTLEEVRHTVMKEQRIIDTLEPVMNQHRLLFARSVIQEDLKVALSDINYSLFYQMTRICRERGALKHDDRLDALAIAIAYWVEAMARDEAKAVKIHEQNMLDRELEVFMEHVIGGGGIVQNQFVTVR